MVLNTQQIKSIKYFIEKKNIFITGQAGTGKTYVIKKIIEWCEQNKVKYEKTALTGTAAILINGKTLHSWAGIGIGDKQVGFYISKINRVWALKKNWIKTDLLIIDEISMMDAKLLELLNTIAQIIRRNEKPFGGIQLIFCGDFYQLPPVSKKTDCKFCFESPIWKQCIEKVIVLKENMRQNDPIFQRCLKEIRKGKCSDETEEILNKCIGRKVIDSQIKPTKLFTLKKSVNEINQKELVKLKKDIRTFNSKIKVKNRSSFKDIEIEKIVNQMDKDNQYEKVLNIAIGAQVMLIKNIDVENGLVNGSRGVVVSFQEMYPIVQFLNGNRLVISKSEWEKEVEDKGKIVVSQIPLRLAWALTIHKCQGSTIDNAELDIGDNIFEYGQSYVALSRVRNLNGLYLNKFNPTKIKAHPTVINFYKNL